MTFAAPSDLKLTGLVGWVRQFGVFIAVGLVCAAVDVGVMYGLMRAEVSPLVSASGGFALGLCLNFLLHSRMTFNAAVNWQRLGRFLGVVALNYGVTLAFVEAASFWLASPLLGKLVSLPVVALNGFFLSRIWVFK
jgi:putative flippase GtrA